MVLIDDEFEQFRYDMRAAWSISVAFVNSVQPLMSGIRMMAFSAAD